MDLQSDLYRKNVFNENRINAPSDTQNISPDNEDSESMNVLIIDGKATQNNEYDVDPNDSNNLPAEDSDIESSKVIMSHNSHMNTENISSLSNKNELKSVIYNGKESYLENSKNPSSSSNSMVQTVAKSPKKEGLGFIMNNNVLPMLDMNGVKLQKQFDDKDIPQFQMYMNRKNFEAEKENKIMHNRVQYKNVQNDVGTHESSFENSTNMENNSAIDDFAEMNRMDFLEPVHENVLQVNSDISSDSFSTQHNSLDKKIRLKGMSAFGHKKNVDDSVISAGPVHEANEVFERIIKVDKLSPNYDNNELSKANDTVDREIAEKDDVLGPFELNKINDFAKHRVQAQSVHITGKSGYSNATTAVDNANNNQSSVLDEKAKQHAKTNSNFKHKKDLSTTTPEDIGMEYYEPNGAWGWKQTKKSLNEVKNGSRFFGPDEMNVAYNKGFSYKQDHKQIINETLQNLPNNTTNYLNNNSDDLLNTEQLVNGQYGAFKNSRILTKSNNPHYSLPNVDEDAYVSDITNPMKIEGLSQGKNYNEAEDFEDESMHSHSGGEDNLNIDQNPLDISSKSFDKLTAMLDTNPFELNLSNTDMIDVLENLHIVQDLNPYVLKLDLSINEGIYLNSESSDISKLVHLKELLMYHMHLNNINFLENGTFFHLEHLNLSHNKLMNFTLPMNLHPLISLKSLNLSHNELKGHLRLDLSRYLPSLEYLNINGNPDLESIEFILPDEELLVMKKLSLIGLKSLKKMDFFCKNTQDKINFVIDEIDITKAKVSLLKSMKDANNVNIRIKHMKISFSTISVDDNFNSVTFPNIETLFVKNSEWTTEIFGCLNNSLKHLQINNVSFDMGSFENSLVKNNLKNLESITISDTNLEPPMNNFFQFIKKNLNTENLREFNISENPHTKIAYFSEARKTKLFRIGTGMIFPKLSKMDGFDLIEIWKDRKI
ncbi:uncharacterized protein HGUI_01158 [Hanseniaspora guilliermondii]|uniref:Uncharacterized protein n=1 Tax=Hanseniaspora guilliermondii TaxID=56406 RepID=A0A1L0FHA4_9ASCO|nr:uncharacterized protein HGUI_01158 [Hanseniaspora guilliermondii]